MEKILIIGCSGSGKSTLAVALGEKLGLPVVHLDQLWWKEGWRNVTREEFDSRLAMAMNMDGWIIDGNYSRTMEMRLAKCDTVIYLDFNRWACLRGMCQRVFGNYGKARPDMAQGCPERFDPAFVKWIWNYNKNNRVKFDRKGRDKQFLAFDKELKLEDFLRSYTPQDIDRADFTDEQIDDMLHQLGKHTVTEMNYNCHACGFNSCKDMAVAIARGLNTPDNCIIHAKSVLIARHSTLSVKNEKLEEVTAECLELSDKLKEDIVNIASSMDSIDESTSATKERAAVVKDLLRNIVTFCSENPTMDAESVEQLIGILNMTIDAFSDLDDNVNTTNESSVAIKESVSKITSLVESINEVLVKDMKK